jgi:hypothetical protein
MHIGTIVWGVTSVALFLAATVATVVANLSVMAMIDEMNLSLPSEKKISWPGRTVHIFTSYPDVCPAGTANRRAAKRFVAFFLAWLVFALFFFFGAVRLA